MELEIYDRIKNLCYERDITVKFLEQQLKLSENTISKWKKVYHLPINLIK